MDSHNEEWRPAIGFKGYEVSSFGRVRRAKVLKPYLNKAGRLQVKLCSPNLTKNKRIHSLVAESFIGPRPEGMEVNHKDGNKLNNRAENLEYVTTRENLKHAYSNGLMNPSFNGRTAKLTPEQVEEIRALIPTCTLREIAKRYGVTNPTIFDIKHSVSWTDKPIRRKNRIKATKEPGSQPRPRQ